MKPIHLALVLSTTLLGCGDDAPASTTGTAGTRGSAGGGGAAGSAGAAGRAGSGGASGTGGAAGSAGSAGAAGGTGGAGAAGSAGRGGAGAGGAGAGAGGAGAGGAGAGGAGAGGMTGGGIQTVFVILMENHNWVDIKGSTSAPYINQTLLTMGSHAEHYMNPPGIHPSEPNYLWLEAGDNFGVLNDSEPSANHQATTDHLVTRLQAANVTWKTYQENISGTTCPVTSSGRYATKHNPMIFFDDVTNNRSTTSMSCIQHMRPFTELATDLTNRTVARYNFITPNLCNDMHDSCAPLNNNIKQGDTWLSQVVPMIMASDAYRNNGAIFITWDESELGDFPIGMIALSPLAKGNGYSNTTPYDHSSLLRTVQRIFGVTPYLRAAANATDLADLFTSL